MAKWVVFGKLWLFLRPPFFDDLSTNDKDSILKKHNTIDTIASSIPANGDINPFGLVLVSERMRDGVTGASPFGIS